MRKWKISQWHITDIAPLSVPAASAIATNDHWDCLSQRRALMLGLCSSSFRRLFDRPCTSRRKLKFHTNN